MPIRINLFAEAQAAEDLRRRDPVKRFVVGGILAVAVILVWWGKLQVNTMLARSDLSRLQDQVNARTNEYQGVLADQKVIVDGKSKLSALQQLSASRFLQGNLLDALQHVRMDGVQLTRLRVSQSYTLTERGAGGGSRAAAHAKSATVAEKIVVTLEARDFSANPGDQVNKFKAAIESEPYFKASLEKTNSVRLISLSAPQTDTESSPFVQFTLECDYPEQTR